MTSFRLPFGHVALGLLIAAALTTVALLAGPSGAQASSGARCSGVVSVGHSDGVQLRGYDITATAVSCDTARGVVHAFLSEKLEQRSERCAGLAQDPPYKGCMVRGYRCLATGRPHLRRGRSIIDEACTYGTRVIQYAESDHSDA